MAVADKIRIFDGAFWLFAASVMLLPIGFGGNRPLPFGLAQAGLALSCLCLIASRPVWKAPKLFPRLQVALVLFALVIAWAWLQTQIFVPASWVHPLWKETGTALGRSLHGAIAIAPEASLAGLNRLVTYIAVGILAYVLAQEAPRARLMVWALWASGVGICVYGLIEYIVGGHKILWFDKWAYEEDLTASFVNRNHFAIYAGMALVSGVALFLQSWRDDVLAQKPTARAEAVRNWLYRKGGWLFFSLLIILLAIVLSHSRAGLMLSLVGVGAYLFFHQLYRRAWSRAIITLLVGFIVLTLVLAVARQYSDRFANLFGDYSSTDRAKVYDLTLEAVHDNPWLGYGLNGFQPVFRLYQRDMIMEFVHAHSDVLESLLDLGLPAALMLWAAILLLVSGLARGIARRRRHGMFPCLGLAASVIVLGHSFVDFSTQIPGVMCPWATLVGIGLAHSWRQAEKEPSVGWRENY